MALMEHFLEIGPLMNFFLNFQILRGLHDKTNKELIILQDDDKNRRTTNSERELAKKNNKAIDLKQRERMALHKNQYNFLPKLNATSSQVGLFFIMFFNIKN